MVNGGNKIAPTTPQIKLLMSLCEEHNMTLPENFAGISGKACSETIQAIMGT